MSGKKTNIKSGLVDRFGRSHDYLRLSITEDCNFRCNYCKPDNKICSGSEEVLSSTEIGQLARAFVQMGIQKIRLTGGEPLLRKDFDYIAKEFATLNIQKAITTNGYLLDRYLSLLKQTRFNSINISLDTLSSSKFKKITGSDKFDTVYENLGNAIQQGFDVKINTVIIRDINDDEIIEFAHLTKELPLTVRFIEFMPFKNNNWDSSKLINHDEILNIISDYYEIKPDYSDPIRNPARYYSLGSNRGKIGIISTVSKPFCESCNRIRITSDGKIKSCLFGASELNLIEALRSGRNIKQVIQNSLKQKPRQHGDKILKEINTLRNNDKSTRGMYAIGG